jgi:hypothetical protein
MFATFIALSSGLQVARDLVIISYALDMIYSFLWFADAEKDIVVVTIFFT